MKEPKAKIYCIKDKYYLKIKWRLGYLSNSGPYYDDDLDKEVWSTFDSSDLSWSSWPSEDEAVKAYDRYCAWINRKRKRKYPKKKLIRKLP